MPSKLRENRSQGLVIIACFLSFIVAYIDNKLNLLFWYYGNDSLNDSIFVYKVFDISLVDYLMASFFWAGLLCVIFFLIYYILIKMKLVQ